MVRDEHHLVLEGNLGPLQQRRFVLEHIARNHQQAVAVFQAQAVESVAQQFLHFAGKTRVGVADVIFISVDDAQVFHLVCVGTFEESVQGAVRAFQVGGGEQGVGNALFQHFGVFFFVGLAGVGIFCGTGAVVVQHGQPAFDVFFQ